MKFARLCIATGRPQWRHPGGRGGGEDQDTESITSVTGNEEGPNGMVRPFDYGSSAWVFIMGTPSSGGFLH